MRLILLLLFIQSFVSAQSEFAPIGAEWYYQYQDYISPYGLGYFKYECVGDSLVKGQVCRQIENMRVQSDSTVLPGAPIFVFERNDTVFRYSYELEDFHILMDYSAEVGDTLLIQPGYINIHKDSIFVVEELTTEIIDGVPLKKWRLNTGICGVYQDYYEKIGSPFGFDPTAYCIIIVDIDIKIRCYSDSEISIQIIDSPCDGILSNVEELSVDKLEIYPNPTDSYLSVNWNTTLKYDIELIGLQGEVLSLITAAESGVTLDLEDFRAGIYLVKITDEFGRFTQRKIINQ